MKPLQVLIAAKVHPVLTEGLEKAGYTTLIKEQVTKEEALQLMPHCAGLITSNKLIVDRQLIDAAPQMQWIGRMGSGMEIIDHAYAATKGIACYSSPEGNCNAVGEHALGMLLGITKKIAVSNAEVKQNQWRREANRGIELEGRTIGIIGFGHTGSSFAKKLMGFDMNILAYDIDETIKYPSYVTAAPLVQIFEEAEFVSLHLPYSAANRYFFNERFVAAMKKRFWVINTSRGDIADTRAILAGLETGKIAGAAIDVIEGEPLEKMDQQQLDILQKISSLQNVIITPHIAGYSVESTYKMSAALLQKICHANVKH